MKRFAYHGFILKASVFSLALNANITDFQPVIDAKIEAFMEALNVPGAAVGILLHGEEFSKGYGFRNI